MRTPVYEAIRDIHRLDREEETKRLQRERSRRGSERGNRDKYFTMYK